MSTSIQEAFRAIDKARDDIQSAEYDLMGGFIFTAVNRSYYAMFYCITSLLYTQDVFAKTHSGAISKFNELFIRTGLIYPPELFRYVQAAFSTRQSADYDMSATVMEQDALTIIANAKALYEATKTICYPLAVKNELDGFPSSMVFFTSKVQRLQKLLFFLPRKVFGSLIL